VWRIADSGKISNSPHTGHRQRLDATVWPRAVGNLPKPPDMPLVGPLARFLDSGEFPTTLKKGEGEGRER